MILFFQIWKHFKPAWCFHGTLANWYMMQSLIFEWISTSPKMVVSRCLTTWYLIKWKSLDRFVRILWRTYKCFAILYSIPKYFKVNLNFFFRLIFCWTVAPNDILTLWITITNIFFEKLKWAHTWERPFIYVCSFFVLTEKCDLTIEASRPSLTQLKNIFSTDWWTHSDR